jgi:hypothetical protein
LGTKCPKIHEEDTGFAVFATTICLAFEHDDAYVALEPRRYDAADEHLPASICV